MESNGPVRVRLIPFVHSLSYRPMKVHLAPNYHLAGDPLELCQVPLGVPGPQFGNHWNTPCKSLCCHWSNVRDQSVVVRVQCKHSANGAPEGLPSATARPRPQEPLLGEGKTDNGFYGFALPYWSDLSTLGQSGRGGGRRTRSDW